jgi:UDP-GlcNAc:undecaprenyl-phosphate GlcNAc-1-phosphate transferase
MTVPLATSMLLGAATAFCGTQLLLRHNVRRLLLERPADCHHTHRVPVPRLGGLALVISFVVVEGFTALFCPSQPTQSPERNVVFWASLAMFALGFCDDLRPLEAKRKLFFQTMIASATCFFGIKIQWFTIPGGGTIHLGLWGPALTVFWLVGLTNLINFIDGLDGLAGGTCLMLMGLTLLISHHTGTFGFLTAGMVGALAAFLWFNWPPARIYMGDGGAYFLGFQIGAFAVVNSQNGAAPPYFIAALLLLAPFILDMALTILRRSLRGLPVFRPDKKHLHHRLLAMGATPRKALISMYALTLPFLLMGLLVVWSRGKLAPIFAVIAVLTLLIYAWFLPFSRRWFAVKSVLGNSLGMRPQTQYTQSLGQWFELEGGRHETLESLWDDFVFVVRRLGFCFVKVRLSDSERIWDRKVERRCPLSARLEVQRGRFGILEFEVPGCPNHNGQELACEDNKSCAWHSKGCPSDPRVFETVSELLAESWTKAIARWSRRRLGPLSFNVSNEQTASRKNGFVSKEHLPT